MVEEDNAGAAAPGAAAAAAGVAAATAGAEADAPVADAAAALAAGVLDEVSAKKICVGAEVGAFASLWPSCHAPTTCSLPAGRCREA